MKSLFGVSLLLIGAFGQTAPPSSAPVRSPAAAPSPPPVAVPDEIPVRRFPNEVKPAGDADVPVEPLVRVDSRAFISGGATKGTAASGAANDGIGLPRLLASVALAKSAPGPGGMEIEHVGDEIRFHEGRADTGRLIGAIRCDPQRVRWQWSDDPNVVPADRAEAVVAALQGIRLELLLIEGQRCDVVFEAGMAPGTTLPEIPEVPEEYMDAEPALSLDPFLPDVRGGDIESSEEVLCTPTFPVSEVKLVVPSPDSAPEGVLPRQVDRTSVAFWSEAAGGKPGHRVATLSLSRNGKLTWSWERLDQASNAAAIEAIQTMARELVVELSGPRGAKSRLRVADSLANAPQLVQAGASSSGAAPSGAGTGGSASLTALQIELLKAIREVSAEFEAEAKAFSNARFRERQQAASARKRQRDDARQRRNAQQRHEEKHGWWDRHGVWHAPDGHMSRAEDDRQDGVIKGAPSGPRGAFGDDVNSWQNKMRAEVAAELAQDKDRYAKPIPLPSPLDQPEFADRAAKFAKDRRRTIPDHRIIAMLDKLAKRIRDAQAAQPQVP